MPEKKRFLKSVTVNFISLVDKGANRKKIIYKYAAEEKNTYQKFVQLKKVDADQHLVYGIVYSPDEPDTDGDFTTKEVIKQMAYDFMENRNTNKVDQQHDYDPDEGFIAESWILEKNDPRFPDEQEGSWAVGIKITNDDTWAKVKSGEITGLSMAGIAIVEEVNKSPNPIFSVAADSMDRQDSQDSLINRMVKAIKEGFASLKIDKTEGQKIINKNKDTEMTPDEITKLVKDSITEALAPVNEIQKSVDELKTLFETKNAEVEKRLNSVEEATPGSSQQITTEEIFKKDKDYKGPAWLS